VECHVSAFTENSNACTQSGGRRTSGPWESECRSSSGLLNTRAVAAHVAGQRVAQIAVVIVDDVTTIGRKVRQASRRSGFLMLRHGVWLVVASSAPRWAGGEPPALWNRSARYCKPHNWGLLWTSMPPAK